MVNGRETLAIFGAGGFGREVAWLAEQSGYSRSALVFVVDDEKFVSAPINGIPVRLLDESFMERDYVIAVGDPRARETVSENCDRLGMRAARLIHPNVQMSEFVALQQGAIICAGNTITTNISIGRHVHVNLDCTIGHDVVIEDFVTVSPGVHISGNVHVQHGAFLGTGVVIINGSAGDPLTIGARAVVAAGACVTKNIEVGALVVGVPAVRKR